MSRLIRCAGAVPVETAILSSVRRHQPSHNFKRLLLQQQYRYHGGSAGAEELASYTAKASKYNLFAKYIRFCNEQQMAAALVTSFVLWSAGDIATQKLESMASASAQQNESASSSSSAATSSPASHSGPLSFLNHRRLAATALFGVAVAGFGGFYWYRLLDKLVVHRWGITPEKSGFVKFTAAKLGLEFAVWHPISLGLFWMCVGVLAEDKTPRAVLQQLKSDFFTALAADVSLWLPIDIINFRYTPVHMQVIVVNLGSLFEAVLLSYLHGASGHHHSSSASSSHNAGSANQAPRVHTKCDKELALLDAC